MTNEQMVINDFLILTAKLLFFDEKTKNRADFHQSDLHLLYFLFLHSLETNKIFTKSIKLLVSQHSLKKISHRFVPFFLYEPLGPVSNLAPNGAVLVALVVQLSVLHPRFFHCFRNFLQNLFHVFSFLLNQSFYLNYPL